VAATTQATKHPIGTAKTFHNVIVEFISIPSRAAVDRTVKIFSSPRGLARPLREYPQLSSGRRGATIALRRRR
jgi:hypothetical protein